MSDRLLEVDHVSKQYRLGMIGGGMLYRDLNSWIARKLGREDPNRKIGVSSSHDGETFLALEDVSPRTSWRASREFRLQLIRELSGRALLEAARKGGAQL